MRYRDASVRRVRLGDVLSVRNKLRAVGGYPEGTKVLTTIINGEFGVEVQLPYNMRIMNEYQSIGNVMIRYRHLEPKVRGGRFKNIVVD